MRHPWHTLDRYVLREFVVSFVVAFLFFFGIFFVNQILLVAEDILAKNVPVVDVVRLLIYASPAIVALSFPFACLVAALMAIGHFASTNELMVMRALGYARIRVFTVVLIASGILGLGSFLLNDVLLPRGTLAYGQLYRSLLARTPELELESNSVRNFQDAILAVGQVDSQGIDGLVIIEPGGENVRTLTSGSARLSNDETGDLFRLVLADVTIADGGAPGSDYELLFAEAMQYNFPLQSIAVSLRNPGPSEMSSRDVLSEIRERSEVVQTREERLWEEVARLRAVLMADILSGGAGDDGEVLGRLDEIERTAAQPVTDRTLRIFLIEFHKKFAIPAACIFFVIFAFPVAARARRSGRALGFGIGLMVSVVYWFSLVGGQSLAVQRVGYPPFLSMWLPNLVVLGLGVLAFAVARSE